MEGATNSDQSFTTEQDKKNGDEGFSTTHLFLHSLPFYLDSCRNKTQPNRPVGTALKLCSTCAWRGTLQLCWVTGLGRLVPPGLPMAERLQVLLLGISTYSSTRLLERMTKPRHSFPPLWPYSLRTTLASVFWHFHIESCNVILWFLLFLGHKVETWKNRTGKMLLLLHFSLKHIQ